MEARPPFECKGLCTARRLNWRGAAGTCWLYTLNHNDANNQTLAFNNPHGKCSAQLSWMRGLNGLRHLEQTCRISVAAFFDGFPRRNRRGNREHLNAFISSHSCMFGAG